LKVTSNVKQKISPKTTSIVKRSNNFDLKLVHFILNV